MALVVFVVAAVGLALSRATPVPPLPKAAALPAALRDQKVKATLRTAHWDRVRVIALDREHWRVTFYDGPRYVIDAAVDPRGNVDATEIHTGKRNLPGSTIVWNPAVLLALALLFVATLAVRPLASLRNLDALVLGLGFSASALILNERLVALHVWIGSATLAYTAIRLLQTGLARQPATAQPRAFMEVQGVSRLVSGAAIVAAVMITLSSTMPSDVSFAGMAGATLLNHGISPYGHIPAEIVHGDTYPFLTYVLYMPFAALSPVRDSFDSLDGGLWLNAIALVAAAALFARNGISHMLAWLAFPPVLLAASGGGNDVPAAAFVVAALVFATRTQLSIALLTLAGWVKIAPALALVPWLARLRGAALIRALALIAALLAAGLVAMAAFGGFDAIDRALTALRFQFERGSWFSLWRQLGSPAVQVVLQATTLAALAATAVIAWRDPDLPLRRLAALAGAVIALLQLSASYWTFAYLPWLLPFILVALFPPAHPRSPRPEPSAP